MFDQWLPLAWLVLLIVVGGGMLLAAATVFVQREWAVLLSMAMGLVMIGFEVFEVAIIDRYAQAVIPSTVVQQVLMSGLGLAIFGLAASLWMIEFRSQHGPMRHANHV